MKLKKNSPTFWLLDKGYDDKLQENQLDDENKKLYLSDILREYGDYLLNKKYESK